MFRLVTSRSPVAKLWPMVANEASKKFAFTTFEGNPYNPDPSTVPPTLISTLKITTDPEGLLA